jgi:hypothetical protein
MTLDKAIEILNRVEPDSRPFGYEEEKEAIRLGIEALKKIKEQRNLDGWLGTLELPGETKE